MTPNDYCTAKADDEGWVLGLWCCPWRATTVHAASGNLCSLPGGAVGTSSSQQVLAQPSKMSVIVSLCHWLWLSWAATGVWVDPGQLVQPLLALFALLSLWPKNGRQGAKTCL